MHVPLFQKGQAAAHFIHGVEQHKLLTVLGILAVLSLVYVLNIPVEFPLVNAKIVDSPHSGGLVQPITYIEHPQYIHEYEQHARYIAGHLENLKAQTRADKVYVVSYRYGMSPSGRTTIMVSRTFEVGNTGITSKVEAYQGISRQSWLLITTYDDKNVKSLTIPAPLPRSYGLELYEISGKTIGYIGMEYWHEGIATQRDNMELLRRTASLIRPAFLQPLEDL